MAENNRPSKTQRKKAVHALQDLGVELVELPEERLEAIEMPENLRDAVMAARSITAHEARRRQMQYIGKLMRKVDAEPIRIALDAWNMQSTRHTAAHKRAESWRERLLADDAALGQLQNEFPDANVTGLQTLVRDALREREANQPPRAFRELYQAVRALLARNER
jgi:ribosome-associated protein